MAGSGIEADALREHPGRLTTLAHSRRGSGNQPPAAEASPRAAPRPLTGGAVLASASRIGLTLFGALATIVLARVLGPKSYAGYVVAQSVLAILLAGTTLGVEHGIMYFVSAGRWPARDAYRSAMRLSLVLGATGAALALGLRLLLPSAFAGLPVWLTAFVAAGLPFALAWAYTSSIALSTDHYEASMLMPVVQAALMVALAVPGALIFGRSGAVVGMVASTVAVGGWAVSWGRRRLPAGGRAERGQLRRAISFGLKGYAANALQIVNYRLDLFVLAAVASTASVGNYGLAVGATSLLWVLPGALANVLYPRVARLSQGDEPLTLELVERKSMRHVGLIVVVSTLLLAASLELFVVPVFGQRFRPAIELGLILLPGAAAIGLSGVMASIIVGRGKPIYSLYGALVTTPLTVGLYFVLIPFFHATGAAVASSVSYSLGFLLSCHFYRRVTGRRALQALVPTRSEFSDVQRLLRGVRRWSR